MKRAKRLPRGVRIAVGDIQAVKIGTHRFSFSDPYYAVLTVSWPAFFALVLAFYVAVNLFFATVYLLGGDVIANARPGVFRDYFFFSIETLATVGYGVMSPRTLYGHIVASTEIISGMIGMAVITGLVFTRFSRPRARLLFSQIAVVAPFNGQPALMVRLVNQRHQIIADATAKITLLQRQHLPDGRIDGRFYDLALLRSTSPMLSLTWSLIHPIDAASPLYQLTADDFRTRDMTFIVSVSGYDESISASITARQSYHADLVKFDHEFVDVLHRRDNGELEMDLRRFHEIRPVAAASGRSSAP